MKSITVIDANNDNRVSFKAVFTNELSTCNGITALTGKESIKISKIL